MECPNCKTEMMEWKGETPYYKFPCIVRICQNCGAVPHPRLDFTKISYNNERDGGILSLQLNEK